MRKLISLCCLIAILMLSACTPTEQPAGATTSSSTTTTTAPTDTTVSTDDSAWSDTDWSDDFIWPDDSDPSDPSDDDNWDDGSATSADLYEEVLPPDNAAQLLNPMKGGSDAEAEALRQEILNAKESYNITGTTYYISPNGDDYNDGTSPETAWRTTDALEINAYLMEAGDAVLFERGGVYRRRNAIVALDGVTYGAYGEGAKPAIYGSLYNYSWGMQWEPSYKENVWKISLATGEAGMMVFNHGEAVGTPHYHGLNELSENGDFYHNTTEAILYLYLDKGYPNVVYEDIEIGTRENIFRVNDNTVDVTIDNLALKYVGIFGVNVQEYTRNIRITNCEIGWVGGCKTSSGEIGFGNAIQVWENTEDSYTENCWIYQVYDAGWSPQGTDTNEASTYKNVVFRNNLVEFCNYSIEVFDRNTSSVWNGLIIEDNILRFAGYGFLPAAKRPDNSTVVGHYVGWGMNYVDHPDMNIVIRNNIFDCSALNLVTWTADGDGLTTNGVTVSGNSFYQKASATNKAINYAANGQRLATNQAELEAAVQTFDQNAKVVKWLS